MNTETMMLIIIAIGILYIFRKIVTAILIPIVLLGIAIYLYLNGDIGINGGGEWLDSLKEKSSELQHTAQETWKKINEQTPQQMPPKQMQTTKPQNSCYAGETVYGTGKFVHWNEGMDTSIIPSEVCYQGCKYTTDTIDFEVDVHERLARLGNWVNSGESCCPSDQIWFVNEQMCCEPNTVCLRITGNQQTN